jgi:hypothetical protein
MSAIATQEIQMAKAPAKQPLFPRLLKFGAIIICDALIFWLVIRLFSLGYYPLVAVFVILTVFVNVVLLRKETYPLRWMVVGLVLMALFTIYPIFFTVWVSFTNYGEGHLITQQQANIDIGYKYLQNQEGVLLDCVSIGLRWYVVVGRFGEMHTARTEALIRPQTGQEGVGELDKMVFKKQSKAIRD